MKNRVIIALVIGLLLIGTTVFIRVARENKTSERDTVMVAIKKTIEESLEEDSDNDGLKNWEEALQGTDPGNPDSDRDGTLDGDEVREGRNPTIPGPDDKAEIGIGATTQDIKDYANPTPTELFSTELFTKYITAKQEGREISSSFISSFVDSLLSKRYATITPEFDPSLIKTTGDTGLQTIKNYGNNLGAVISEPLPSGIDNELMVIQKITATGEITGEDKSALSVTVERDKRIVSGLSKMVVPIDALYMHAKLIDCFNLRISGLEGLAGIDNDPVGGYTKLVDYGNGMDILSEVSEDLKSFFVGKNIIFSSMDSGYELTK